MTEHQGENQFADLDERLEEIFERADDYMIRKKSYKEAVRDKWFSSIIGETL